MFRDDTQFVLKFANIEEFAKFIAVIRGDDDDHDRIKAMAARIHRATLDLSHAEHKAEDKPSS